MLVDCQILQLTQSQNQGSFQDDNHLLKVIKVLKVIIRISVQAPLSRWTKDSYPLEETLLLVGKN